MKPIQIKTLSLGRMAAIAGAIALSIGAQPVSARPVGVDVSSYQGSGVNWGSVKGGGYTFGWAKATEGTYLQDADFSINENNGKGAGVVLGAYHFARPDLDSPGSEASYFWGTASGYIQADGKTLMPMLDMETWNGVVGASSYSAWANSWNSTIQNDASGKGVSITPFIYVSACSACNFNTSVSGWLSDIANYNGESPQTGGPWNVCGNCDVWGSGVWTAWQYSSSGSVPGVSGNCDVDVLGGSLSAATAGSTADPHINPCVARNAGDGHMEVFAVGKTGLLYHSYFSGGAWTSWAAIGGWTFAANTIPAVQYNSDGRLQLFIIGTDGHLDTIYQQTAGSSTSWSGWTSIAGWTFSQQACLAANTNADGRIEVFVVGTDGQLDHVFENTAGNSTSWSGWGGLGGSWSQNAAISAGNDADGRQEVFLIGNTGNLYHIYQTAPNAGWSGYGNLGGTWSQTARTALTRNSDGRLEIFIIGSTGELYHSYQTAANGGWYGWPNIGGWTFSQQAKPVAALNTTNGTLQVLVIGTDGHMDTVNSANAWGGGWSSLPSSPAFTQNIRPCLGVNADGRLEVFTTSPGSDMVHAYQTSPGGGWYGWPSLGGSWN